MFVKSKILCANYIFLIFPKNVHIKVNYQCFTHNHPGTPPGKQNAKDVQGLTSEDLHSISGNHLL